MKQFINYDLSTGEIVNYGECEDSLIDFYRIDGKGFIEQYGTPDNDYVKNGLIVSYTESQKQTKASNHPRYFIWSNDSFSWQDPRTNEDKYNESDLIAKAERNSLLLNSDWTQIPNNPLTSEQQQEWATYRQALRDITDQSGYPFNIIWPVQPE